MNSSRPNRLPRSTCQPAMSASQRPKIGSAEANRIRKIRAIGAASRSPRSTDIARAGTRSGRPSVVGRAGADRPGRARDDRFERPGRHRRDHRRRSPGDRQPGHRDQRRADECGGSGRVEQRQERVATDGDERGEDHGHQRQPGVERVRRPSATAERPAERDDGGREQRDVQAERRPVQHGVGEESDGKAAGEQATGDGSIQGSGPPGGRRGQARVDGQGLDGSRRRRVAGTGAMARLPDERPGGALRPVRGRLCAAGGRPSSRRPSSELLDHLEPRLGDASRLIDIGTGTGQLALAALARWPQVSMVGVDASRGWPPSPTRKRTGCSTGSARTRFSTEIAFADALPFDDASVRRGRVVVRLPARPEPGPRLPRGASRPPPGRRPGLGVVAAGGSRLRAGRHPRRRARCGRHRSARGRGTPG